MKKQADNQTITLSRRQLNEFISAVADFMFEQYREEIEEKIFEWKSEDNRPRVVNEPPLDLEPAIIDPKSETQVADTSLPVEEKEWMPGNIHELGMAMKQVSEMVPEKQIRYFWSQLKRLIDRTMDEEDEGRMEPRLGVEEIV